MRAGITRKCGCGSCTALVFENIDENHRVYNVSNGRPHTCGETITMEDVLGKKETKMNSVKIISRPVTRGISSFNLSIGEYGRVLQDNLDFAGHVVLRVNNYVVDLTNPKNVWESTFTAPQVEKLNTGDKIEVTVGFTPEFTARILSIARVNKINAIKEVREVTLWGLKESKEYVDQLLSEGLRF